MFDIFKRKNKIFTFSSSKSTVIIAEAYWMLVRSSYENNMIFETIRKEFDKLQPCDYEELDFYMRRNSIFNYSLFNINPLEIKFQKLSSENQRTIILLSTMSPNGYFREQALKMTTAIEIRFSIPFLIVRLNDWVERVRNVSLNAISETLKENNLEDLFIYTDLIVSLNFKTRSNFNEIITNFSRLLIKSEAINLTKITESNFKGKTVNFLIEKVILEKTKDFIELKKLLEKISDANLQILILNRLTNLNDINAEDILPCLKMKISAKAKIYILRKCVEYSYKDVNDKLYELVFSKYKTVRKEARELILKNEEINFLKLYKDNLENENNVSISILGIGEVGTISDCPQIIPYLESKIKINKKCALKSLNELGWEFTEETLLKLLLDADICISSLARRIIIDRKIYLDPKKLSNLYNIKISFVIRKNILQVLFSNKKWTSLVYLLSYLDFDIELNAFVEQSIEKWQQAYNRSYSNPTNIEISTISRLLDKHKSKRPSLVENLYFSLRSVST